MKTKSFIPMLCLQIFAEGAGDGGAQGQGVTAEAASQQNKGVKSNPLGDVQYGIQEEGAPAAGVQTVTTTEPEDLNAEFEKLIKGKFQKQYGAKVQDTIQKRLKGTQETVDKYNALAPTLELMARKYGVEEGDIEALCKAVADDDAYYEQEALERGMSVKQLKEFKKMEQANAELRRQMQERDRKANADKLVASWMQQAEAIKQVYPSFDMNAEMNNPKFLDLLKSNIDVRTAYEVLHKDEIIPAAMQFTAKTVESKIAKKIAANGTRPIENGVSSGSPAVVKNDVTQLTKADRQEIIRRVQRGEKIRF